MTEFITNLIPNEFLATAVMSFVPLIELKGGIVFARAAGLGFFKALGLAYLGSTAAVVLVFFLLKPILALLKRIKWFNGFAVRVEGYFESKAADALKDGEKKGSGKSLGERALKQLGVFIFVAIPLPMTGVWTGTAVAVFLGLKFKDVILPVALGNLLAGIIISLLAELCIAVWTISALDYILYGLFALAVVLLVVAVIKIAGQNPEKKRENGVTEDNEEK